MLGFKLGPSGEEGSDNESESKITKAQ